MKTATYLRVSTTEQTHDPQRAELANWGRIIMRRARVRCCSQHLFERHGNTADRFAQRATFSLLHSTLQPQLTTGLMRTAWDRRGPEKESLDRLLRPDIFRSFRNRRAG